MINRIKKFGEVFTPASLVLKMLKQLPQEVFIDPNKTFADLTGCGNGAFLVPVLKLKLKLGSTPEQALLTIYGIDIQEDNVLECRENLLVSCEKITNLSRTQEWIDIVTKHIVCANALTCDIDKIFL
jgi:type I restriction-modification system DNA methylase subunit